MQTVGLVFVWFEILMMILLYLTSLSVITPADANISQCFMHYTPTQPPCTVALHENCNSNKIHDAKHITDYKWVLR